MPLNTQSRRRSSARVTTALIVSAMLTACGGVHLQSPIAQANSGPPQTFVQTTSETRSSRVIELREGITKTAAFRAATDLLTQRFSVDVSDQRAGFLMTPWQASLIREGVPDLRYRMRLIVRFLGDDWKQVAVRAEANWQRGDEWDVGYDTKALDDITTELRNRIGKRL